MKNDFKILSNYVAVYAMYKGERKVIKISLDSLTVVGSIKGTWSLKYATESRRFYAYTHLRKDGKIIKLYMHRLILNPPTNLVIDHLNGNGIDNRLTNIRVTTNAGNIIRMDIKLRTNNTSGYRGVSFCKERGLWESYCTINGKRKNLGRFKSKKLAAQKAKEVRNSHPGMPQ